MDPSEMSCKENQLYYSIKSKIFFSKCLLRYGVLRVVVWFCVLVYVM